jgi:hypothetical protein
MSNLFFIFVLSKNIKAMATYIDGMEDGKHNSDNIEVKNSSKMLEIKITGEGTADEIVGALRRVAKNIALNAAEHGVNMMDGSVWEDSTLLTEIKTV